MPWPRWIAVATGYLLPATVTHCAGAKRGTNRFADMMNLWYERSKQRRQLLELADDPDMFKDLGLSNHDLWREERKPFWRR